MSSKPVSTFNRSFQKASKIVLAENQNLVSVQVIASQSLDVDVRPSGFNSHKISLLSFVWLWRMLLDCFATHPPWVVMYEDGSEFYYSHCFDDCLFFWTMTYLCAKTQIVGVICLWRGVGGGGGGSWACQGISDPNVIGFTWFLSLELTNLIKQRENTKRWGS